jgi:hypothetical protein
MPDVRHACAALHRGTGSAFSSPDTPCTDSPRSGISASRVSATHNRRLSTSPSRFAGVPALGTSPSQTVGSSPGFAAGTLLGPLRCPRASRSPALGSRGRSGLSGFRPAIRVQHSLHRETATVGFTASAARRHIPPADGHSSPSFTAPSLSRSVWRTHRTFRTAPELSSVRQHPTSAPTRPVLIRSCLTPACSGLAALAADASR